MAEKHSKEELPGVPKYENESVYQRNPDPSATEFKSELPTPEAEEDWEDAEEAADQQ